MKIIYSLYFTQIYISGDSERASPEVFQTTAARISKLTNARISIRNSWNKLARFDGF